MYSDLTLGFPSFWFFNHAFLMFSSHHLLFIQIFPQYLMTSMIPRNCEFAIQKAANNFLFPALYFPVYIDFSVCLFQWKDCSSLQGRDCLYLCGLYSTECIACGKQINYSYKITYSIFSSYLTFYLNHRWLARLRGTTFTRIQFPILVRGRD